MSEPFEEVKPCLSFEMRCSAIVNTISKAYFKALRRSIKALRLRHVPGVMSKQLCIVFAGAVFTIGVESFMRNCSAKLI